MHRASRASSATIGNPSTCLLYAFGVFGVIAALLTGALFTLALVGVLTFGFGAIVEAIESASKLAHLDAKLAATNVRLAETHRDSGTRL